MLVENLSRQVGSIPASTPLGHGVEISTQKLVILIEFIRDFSQSLRGTGLVTQIRSQPLPLTSFLIHYLLIFLPFNVMHPELLMIKLSLCLIKHHVMKT
jgi:hypothetical protein